MRKMVGLVVLTMLLKSIFLFLGKYFVRESVIYRHAGDLRILIVEVLLY